MGEGSLDFLTCLRPGRKSAGENSFLSFVDFVVFLMLSAMANSERKECCRSRLRCDGVGGGGWFG